MVVWATLLCDGQYIRHQRGMYFPDGCIVMSNTSPHQRGMYCHAYCGAMYLWGWGGVYDGNMLGVCMSATRVAARTMYLSPLSAGIVDHALYEDALCEAMLSKYVVSPPLSTRVWPMCRGELHQPLLHGPTLSQTLPHPPRVRPHTL